MFHKKLSTAAGISTAGVFCRRSLKTYDMKLPFVSYSVFAPLREVPDFSAGPNGPRRLRHLLE